VARRRRREYDLAEEDRRRHERWRSALEERQVLERRAPSPNSIPARRFSSFNQPRKVKRVVREVARPRLPLLRLARLPSRLLSVRRFAKNATRHLKRRLLQTPCRRTRHASSRLRFQRMLTRLGSGAGAYLRKRRHTEEERLRRLSRAC